MKYSEAYAGNYLDAAMIEKPIALKVKSVAEPGSEKDASGKTIKQAILYFEKTDKGLILNKTNARALTLMFGNDSKGWLGKEITLERAFVDAFGQKNVPAIRVVLQGMNLVKRK